MNEIKKYVDSYIVYFKNENDEPVEIWNEAGKMLIWDLNNLTFVNINWSAYNKFEIKKVEKRKSDYETWKLLDWLPEKTKNLVRKEMKLYKQELTLWVVNNMILKYKW